jgi:hypothetical protein
MMSCVRLRPILGLFLEKETDPLETLEVRRHLDSCASCQRRARRLEQTLARCDAIPEQLPAQDIAGAVMQRLTSLKRSAVAANPAMAAKWSGIGLILAAGLTAISMPGAPVLGLLARPVAFLVSLASGGEQLDRLRQIAGKAASLLPGALAGGVDADVASRTGFDGALAIQLLGTALVFGLGLAIPVAILTAWLLHRESASGPARD